LTAQSHATTHILRFDFWNISTPASLQMGLLQEFKVYRFQRSILIIESSLMLGWITASNQTKGLRAFFAPIILHPTESISCWSIGKQSRLWALQLEISTRNRTTALYYGYSLLIPAPSFKLFNDYLLKSARIEGPRNFVLSSIRYRDSSLSPNL
jgi:hypothetical protein